MVTGFVAELSAVLKSPKMSSLLSLDNRKTRGSHFCFWKLQDAKISKFVYAKPGALWFSKNLHSACTLAGARRRLCYDFLFESLLFPLKKCPALSCFPPPADMPGCFGSFIFLSLAFLSLCLCSCLRKKQQPCSS